MADGANSGAFSKRGTFVLVLFAILAFVAFLYLVGQGGLSGNANNGRAHAASTGLNGFAGLTRLLEADGFPVIRSRNTAALDDPGLLVLTPPAEMDAEELTKIVDACRAPDGSPAKDLKLLVRLRVSSEFSELSLASKFGTDLIDAPVLLQQTRQHCDWLGVCFHVGSQAMTPFAYVQALERARAAIASSSVVIDIIDVGGGFPSIYPGMEPPPLEDYFDVIFRASESLPISYSAELWCEPGRALCAEYSSLLAKVEKRRGTELYINDGAYGALYDAAHLGWKFPVRALGHDEHAASEDFSLYGPTCDDADYMEGPFALPADIKAGDYVEIGMLGAYGAAMKTDFNGFGANRSIVVDDDPMMSLYDGRRVRPETDNVVNLR